MTAIGDWRHLTHKPRHALTWRLGLLKKLILIAVLIAN